MISVLLVILLIILPIVTIIAYESIFGKRFETESWALFSVYDYEGLRMERSDFQSDDITLAGYKYSKHNNETKGVIVIAHSLGGGGHNMYMPFVDYFCSQGYYVFAFDACGNDNSGGDSVKGLPQGLIDLDNAINHIKSVEEYKDLPLALFGHSWGAYAVGNVLYRQPQVKAVAMIAGFNETEEFMNKYLDKKKCFEPDPMLMGRIIEMFDTYCK